MNLKKWDGRRRTWLLILLAVSVSLASMRMIDAGKTVYAKLQLFNAIVDRIQEDYVEETSTDMLIDEAIRGMLRRLDPHTTYFTEDQFNRWNQNFEGYSGIGITYDIIDNKITVLSVIPQGPSDIVGLLPGDRIVAIEGVSAIGIQAEDVPLKLKGPKGTKVKVTVERFSDTRPLNFTITRDEVHIQSIPYAFMIQPSVGYVNIQRFSATTSDELKKALEELNDSGMKSLVLDLRNNGGGYLDEAIEVADLFLSGGKTIVSTRGRSKETDHEFYSTRNDVQPFLPMIVLIDRISASASEIVAGALQDWDRALIVGETSFGKGLIQSQYRFRDGSALLMTTAKYQTPSGRLIQRPYTSEDSYYAVITDDSVRKGWENDKNRPKYKTRILSRTLTGGGGISPDIFLKSRFDTLNQDVRRLIQSPKRVFYTYTEQLSKNRQPLIQDENEFIRNYQPNGTLLQQFYTFLTQNGIEMTQASFTANKDMIRYLLKQALAERLFGSEARYKVQMLRDHPLLEALQYLPKAEELHQKVVAKGS